ncbi:Short-chain dehydrogenase [Frankia canadensis]|uniref:Short-chain dehydrogenase n=1 Tax=Frankia canadensis TaxID=1836972 RepID=A0A2I2KXF1_9ACTN|nr:SDR family oxidoreductase [Frankia canadensis]SNQ50345.1 Short-chain dehydrogenase [Frankia canadensis]SOU57635.1 Short-chain dehydrogenase [Frankia canadensis]
MGTQLQGRTAIVTGAGQGLGRAIALALGDRGANIVINGRTKAKLDPVVAELATRGTRAVAVAADVARRADVDATVAVAVDAFGGVDILVNNAQATAPPARLTALDDETFDLYFGSGARGTLYAMQACHPVMKQRGGGCVVNFGSSTAIIGDVGFGPYVMTKEAIRGLSRVAAREWGRDNIRVNVICPAALTPAGLEFQESHPEAYRAMLKTVPLGRMGDESADIANAVAALVGDDFRYLTGATLMLDGGRLLFP